MQVKIAPGNREIVNQMLEAMGCEDSKAGVAINSFIKLYGQQFIQHFSGTSTVAPSSAVQASPATQQYQSPPVAAPTPQVYESAEIVSPDSWGLPEPVETGEVEMKNSDIFNSLL